MHKIPIYLYISKKVCFFQSFYEPMINEISLSDKYKKLNVVQIPLLRKFYTLIFHSTDKQFF